MTATQFTLFRNQWPHAQEFEAWRHTPGGGHVVNLFIREAIRARRNGELVTAKGVWEDIRRRMGAIRARLNRSGIHVDEAGGFALNNNHTPYCARLAMERAPELQGYFRLRNLGATNQAARAVVVPLVQKTA
jgi:hypothetical protein